MQRAYARGLEPAEVVERAFKAIEAAGDPGIFISLVDRRAARKAAQKLGRFDPAKPLWGIPFAVKDNIDAAGLPTTAACPAFAYKPKASATAVARLLSAGAILIGKTNLDQFATGLVGVRTPYPVPKNTFDPAIVPGGSSSGSAVAVARGLVAFALGTDTAGSGRVPAGLNNIVGLKPSVGAVSNKGVVPACSTLDCVSVFAGTVDDAWAVYAVMAGEDKDDPFSRPIALGRPGARAAARRHRHSSSGGPEVLRRCRRQGGLARRREAAAGHRRRPCRDRHGAVQRGGGAALRGRPGWPSAMRRSARSWPSTRARCIPSRGASSTRPRRSRPPMPLPASIASKR